jgi:hypothetical protein
LEVLEGFVDEAASGLGIGGVGGGEDGRVVELEVVERHPYEFGEQEIEAIDGKEAGKTYGTGRERWRRCSSIFIGDKEPLLCFAGGFERRHSGEKAKVGSHGRLRGKKTLREHKKKTPNL